MKLAPPLPDLIARVEGRYVAYTGHFAGITHDQFLDILEQFGAKYSNGIHLGNGVALLVIGQRQLPINKHGHLTHQLRQARVKEREGSTSLQIVTEQQFLDAVGMELEREQISPLLTTATLCELLDVPRQRIRAWVQSGLIQPVTVNNGVWHFDFQQVAAARTLSDLLRSGVTLGRIRRSLTQLSRWLPQMAQPLQQLSVLENCGRLVVRLEDGEIAAIDGQLHLDFDPDHEADVACLPLRIDSSPRTASQWFDQGIEQESAGYLEDAAESYREALRLGGPDAQVCFDLANVLHQLGRRQQALERYHQVLELDANHVDAWNNLGIVLSELDRPDEAASAFRRALQIDPANSRAHYNLADTLDDLGLSNESLPHWQAYLRSDPSSQWAHYARSRVAQA